MQHNFGDSMRQHATWLRGEQRQQLAAWSQRAGTSCEQWWENTRHDCGDIISAQAKIRGEPYYNGEQIRQHATWGLYLDNRCEHQALLPQRRYGISEHRQQQQQPKSGSSNPAGRAVRRASGTSTVPGAATGAGACYNRFLAYLSSSNKQKYMKM